MTTLEAVAKAQAQLDTYPELARIAETRVPDDQERTALLLRRQALERGPRGGGSGSGGAR